MQIGRRAIMVGGTFFLAAATGHIMQNTDAFGARLRTTTSMAVPDGLILASLTSASTQTSPSPATPSNGATVALSAAVLRSVPDFPDLPAIEPLPLRATTQLATRLSDVTSDYIRPETLADREYDTYGIACAEPALTLTPLKSAMLGMALTAPCHPNEIVRISHAGMAFAAMTDDRGSFSATIPALAAQGEVSVHLEHGRDLSASRLVPDLGSVSRVALSTRGTAGLHLNAYINGAANGGPGHIRPDNIGLPTLGLGGFLVNLGDPTLAQPMLAEVFTVAAIKLAPRTEVVATVEPENCGHDVLGTIFTQQGTVLPTTGAISVAMPDCDALGDLVVMDMGRALTTVALASAQNQP